MPQTQRQPVPFKPSRTEPIQIITDAPRSDRIIDISTDARQVQEMSAGSDFRFFRRLFFVWFRVYVNETKHGKSEKVNVSIPIPIPFIGAAFARQLSLQKSARLANEVRRGEIGLEEALESTMGFELVRVHESHPERGKSQLVVVGLD